MRNKRIKTILLFALLGILAMMIISAIMPKKEATKTGNTASTTQTTYGKVVVASIDISPRVEITKDMVKEVEYPVQYIHPNCAKSVDQIIGKLSETKITTGEFVMTDAVFDKSTGGLTYKLNKDEVACTIPATELTAGAGLLQVGDQVNVEGLFDDDIVGTKLSTFVLTDLRIVAIGSEMSEGYKIDKAGSLTSVTVALLPEQEKILMWAEKWGQVSMIPKSAYNQEATENGKGIQAEDIFGKYDSFKTKKYIADLKQKLEIQELVQKLK